jgi:hypothetical protein
MFITNPTDNPPAIGEHLMNMHKLTYYVAISILFLFLLTGCVTEKSILTQETTCQYPCWQNIQPGKTTSDEATQILLQISFIDSKPSTSPRKIDNQRSYNSWTFQKKIREMGGGITYYNNIVAYIDFDVINRTEIKEMVAYYGNPELISVISGQADTQWLKIHWIYPKQGVLIIHFTPHWWLDGTNVDITSNLTVDRVYYFNPDLYETLFENVFFSPYNLDVIQQSIQKWEGYETYSYTEIK